MPPQIYLHTHTKMHLLGVNNVQTCTFLLVKTVYMFKHCISEVKNLMFMLKEKLICGVKRDN